MTLVKMACNVGTKWLKAEGFKDVHPTQLPGENQAGELPDKLAAALCRSGLACAVAETGDGETTEQPRRRGRPRKTTADE